MTFTEAYKTLNSAQKQAVDTIDGPVLVIAGPGTGKTQLLALRAANILQNTDTAPQNILCLTYTEVGARNMRDRLSQYIGQQAYDVRISTYHSFGSEIIRQYSEYFNEYGADQPVDKIGQDTIMHEIYDELPASNPLWRPEVYLKDSLGFISECKRANLKPKDLRKIADSNEAFINKASKITTVILQPLKKIDKNTLSLFEALFIELQKIQKNDKLPAKLTPLDSTAVTELAEAIVLANESGKTNSLTVWKNNWLKKDSDDNWIFAGAKEISKLRGGAEIYELYLKKLKTKKLFDYDDMILRAIDGIERNDELRFTLQEQYQYIMLDEFQDTNLAQLRIIELLTDNPSSNGKPNILAVGDDDQAIFSFQGADLTNMLRFSKLYKGVETITLTENWRSHSDILELGTAVSNQIEDRLHKRLGSDKKLLIAKKPNLPKESVLKRHEFKSDIAQFAWVAEQIQELINKGTDPSEIAVLAPKHKYLEPLVPFLTNKDIPIRYDKRENVLEDQHILDLINMAKLVKSLGQGDQATANSIWPSVLSAEEWQIPTSAIWELSWESNKNIYNDSETSWQALMLKKEALKPIALFFTKLSLIVDTESLESVLDYLTGVTPLKINEPDLESYKSPYFDFYFGESKRQKDPVAFTKLLSNLTVLRQHLREYKKEDTEPLKIDDLLEFVTAYQNANEKLLNTSPYHSASSAVQLMTAYGAKGLEFEVVFVLATLDEVWGMKSKGQSSNISLPQNLKIIRKAGSSKDERKRLFFVALTRAKHTLIMTSYSQNYAGKGMTNLEYLDEVQENNILQSRIMPIGKNIVEQSDQDAPELQHLEKFWQNRHIADSTKSDLKEYIKPRLETFQLSATHLNSFTDLIYGGPEQFFINTILKFPKAPTADGQYGNAVHETLDALQNIIKAKGELPDTEEVLQIFEQKLKAKRLSKNDYNRQLERGKIALSIFMPFWWPNFNPANESEKTFKDEGVFVGEAHLTGTLDQLVIDHAEQAMQVVDFKTGKPYSYWKKDVKMHKYRQQLQFYKLLVEGSHTYGKYIVEQGKLVFVEPNEDDKIDELTLEYSEAELEHTKKLIVAIWARIMNLDFPDTSEYSKDLKGIQQFETWLIDNHK